MRPSRIVLLLVAIIAGGLAAYLATRGGDRPAEVVSVPEVIEEQKTKVVVAIAPIGVGERLSERTIGWQDWPEGAVRTDYISELTSPDALEQLSGVIARFEIFPGEPILEAKLVRSEQGYLSAVLESGKRAISIPVNAESASGGFIVPNDRVDVVLTRNTSSGQISQTLVDNVKVLAIGSRLGEKGTTGAPSDPENPRAEVFSSSTIATLELDPTQGETVINGTRIGTLSLALRSILDFKETGARPRGASQTVQMIRYGQRRNVMTANANTDAFGENDTATEGADSGALPE